MKEGNLKCMDLVENLTKTKSKHIKMMKDEIFEEFVYTGDLNQLFADLVTHKLDDILIEEPSLDEIFIHYYERKEKK